MNKWLEKRNEKTLHVCVISIFINKSIRLLELKLHCCYKEYDEKNIKMSLENLKNLDQFKPECEWLLCSFF